MTVLAVGVADRFCQDFDRRSRGNGDLLPPMFPFGQSFSQGDG